MNSLNLIAVPFFQVWLIDNQSLWPKIQEATEGCEADTMLEAKQTGE